MHDGGINAVLLLLLCVVRCCYCPVAIGEGEVNARLNEPTSTPSDRKQSPTIPVPHNSDGV